METTCQASYPLNSENASPFGTFTVYLSCAGMAEPLTTASTPVIIAIVRILLPFIASTSFIKFSVHTSLFTHFCSGSLLGYHLQVKFSGGRLGRMRRLRENV